MNLFVVLILVALVVLTVIAVIAEICCARAERRKSEGMVTLVKEDRPLRSRRCKHLLLNRSR